MSKETKPLGTVFGPKVDHSRQLLLPTLIDLSYKENHNRPHAKVKITTGLHKFAQDAAPSGSDILKCPIFGSQAYLHGKKIFETSYGLPFFRLKRNTKPRIKFINETKFTFNLHLHGLNTASATDGATMEVYFGPKTRIGRVLNMQYPTINNNSTLLWIHAHNCFLTMEFIYSGIAGLVQIVDDISAQVTDMFQYGDNHLMLICNDMDLDEKGTSTFSNLITDENRSCFTVINGLSSVNWYSSSSNVPFVHNLYHKTTKNLVKIDLLNSSSNWRVLYVGVCDEHCKIKRFFLVQNDGGLMNPTELTIVAIPIAARISILVNLDDFTKQRAYVFFYNFDLTETLDASLVAPGTNILISPVPDNKSNKNPSVYPTPIPDPGQENQQENYTNLTYPQVPIISQVNEVLENGNIPQPKTFTVKPWLQIRRDKTSDHKTMDLYEVIKEIRKVVFGPTCYESLKYLLNQPYFEYNPAINYLALLNPQYYYNLPDFSSEVPFRNIILFPDTEVNSNVPNGNPLGSTEYCNGANRVMQDLWNSSELNLNYALSQYALNPNNFKPTILPSSLFRIFKTDDRYSNTGMLSNDHLIIQFFSTVVSYGDISRVPDAQTEITFPPTPPCHLLNLQEWVDLVNESFAKIFITLPSTPQQPLSTLLSLDWTFFPFVVPLLSDQVWYIKSVLMKTVNLSNFYVRLLGRWPLLQFFGKSLNGGTLDSTSSLIQQRQAFNLKRARGRAARKPVEITTTKSKKDCCPINQGKVAKACPIKNSDLYIPCNEGNLDNKIQQFYPQYATNDPDIQIPIACMKRNAELIISPQNTFTGFYDGFLTDNLMNFAVREDKTERWIYRNGDNADSHPLHFHDTSGYVSTSVLSETSPGLVSLARNYANLLYSREVYGIGPQQSLEFYLTWKYYSSYNITKSPHLNCLGYRLHCHIDPHSSTSMNSQFFIHKSKSKI